MNGFLTRKNVSQWNFYLCNLPVMFPRPTITLDSLFSRNNLRNLEFSTESLIASISKSFQLKLSMIRKLENSISKNVKIRCHKVSFGTYVISYKANALIPPQLLDKTESYSLKRAL